LGEGSFRRSSLNRRGRKGSSREGERAIKGEGDVFYGALKRRERKTLHLNAAKTSQKSWAANCPEKGKSRGGKEISRGRCRKKKDKKSSSKRGKDESLGRKRERRSDEGGKKRGSFNFSVWRSRGQCEARGWLARSAPTAKGGGKKG